MRYARPSITWHNAPDVLTTQMAASLLHMDTASISRKCKSGEIKAVKGGKSWYINKADLAKAYGMGDKTPEPTTLSGSKPTDPITALVEESKRLNTMLELLTSQYKTLQACYEDISKQLAVARR